jgi:hypothetical protein
MSKVSPSCDDLIGLPGVIEMKGLILCSCSLGQKEPGQCKQQGILIYSMAIILFSSPQVMINLVMNCSRQQHLCPTLPHLFLLTYVFLKFTTN